MKEEAKELYFDTLLQYPEVRDEIEGLYQLFLDEVEAGESEVHELDLFVNALDELTEEL